MCPHVPRQVAGAREGLAARVALDRVTRSMFGRRAATDFIFGRHAAAVSILCISIIPRALPPHLVC